MENYTNWPNILRNSGYPQISGSFTVQRNEHSTVRYFIDTAICPAVRKPDGEELAPSLVLSEQDDKAGYEIYVDYRDISDNDQLPGPGEERVTADGVIHIPAENPETGYFYRRLVPMGP